MSATEASKALPGAMTQYLHYIGFILGFGGLVTQRALIQPGMGVEDEDSVVVADTVYGLSGFAVFTSGFYIVKEYGKGWDFYSHEPFFWLELTLLAAMAASSIFPTWRLTKRALDRRDAGVRYEPMSYPLAARLIEIVNGELIALSAVPLVAALSARGVGYSKSLEWQTGAAVVALTFFGYGYKYWLEAYDWDTYERDYY